MPVHLINLTRSNEIGANSYVLDTGDARIALDSGMHPKGRGLNALPDYRWVMDDSIDACLLTHAHLDHLGSLPVLLRRNPRAPVVSTALTAELSEAMLHNSVNVMTAQRCEELKEYPLFTHREVDQCVRRWVMREPGRSFEVGDTGVRAEFFDAGHLPGAVGIQLEAGGLNIFYTGDVNFEDQTMMKGAAFPDTGIDVLIIETTRGAAARREDYTRRSEMLRLAESITRTLNRGGSVLLPLFALGKTQEILLMLHEMKRSGLIPRHAPIHIGGLATRMTQIVDKHAGDMPRYHPRMQILEHVDGLIRAKRGERDISYAPGRIYALSSGMMTENTASNDFAFRFLDRRTNALLFVGYADPESPAAAAMRANKGDPVQLHHAHSPVTLECDVENFDFSGHAPRTAILDYILRVNPKQCVLVHGDKPALEWFTTQLAEKAPGMKVVLPLPGERLELG